MFAATRGFWTEGVSGEELERWTRDRDPYDPMEDLALCLLLCPVAFDVALLPITATHDLLYGD